MMKGQPWPRPTQHVFLYEREKTPRTDVYAMTHKAVYSMTPSSCRHETRHYLGLRVKHERDLHYFHAVHTTNFAKHEYFNQHK